MSAIRNLAGELERAVADAEREFEQVVSRGALQIKQGWQRRWRGHPHIPHLPNAINYDLRRRGTVIEAEIGVDKSRRQGPLGNIIEYGTVKNAPIPGGAPALDMERPRFERAVADVAARLLAGRRG